MAVSLDVQTSRIQLKYQNATNTAETFTETPLYYPGDFKNLSAMDQNAIGTFVTKFNNLIDTNWNNIEKKFIIEGDISITN